MFHLGPSIHIVPPLSTVPSPRRPIFSNTDSHPWQSRTLVHSLATIATIALAIAPDPLVDHLAIRPIHWAMW